MASTRAVGKAMLPNAGDFPLVVAGGAAHVVISLAWGVVMEAVLPRRHTVLAGAAAGLAIAAIDLGVIGRRLPSIRALDGGPEVLDHLAYGMVVGAVVSRRRRAATARAQGATGSRS